MHLCLAWATQQQSPGQVGPLVYPVPSPVITNANESSARNIQIALKPTPVASTKSSGVVVLELGGGPNASGSKLSIHIQGLSTGNYEVQASRKSEASVVMLGRFTIDDPTRSPDTVANNNKNETGLAHESEFLDSRVQIELTSDLLADDINRISVLDAAGNVVLRGELK
jgi:hypothetical protein